MPARPARPRPRRHALSRGRRGSPRPPGFSGRGRPAGRAASWRPPRTRPGTRRRGERGWAAPGATCEPRTASIGKSRSDRTPVGGLGVDQICDEVDRRLALTPCRRRGDPHEPAAAVRQVARPVRRSRGLPGLVDRLVDPLGARQRRHPDRLDLAAPPSPARSARSIRSATRPSRNAFAAASASNRSTPGGPNAFERHEVRRAPRRTAGFPGAAPSCRSRTAANNGRGAARSRRRARNVASPTPSGSGPSARAIPESASRRRPSRGRGRTSPGGRGPSRSPVARA